MYRYGIFMNFWENTWDADHAKYIKKAADIGFDILEFQAQALLKMSDSKMDELKNIAADYGIELTYSLGLDPAYDISSYDEDVRKGGIEYLSNIIERIHKMDGKLLSGVSYAGWGIPSYEFEKSKLMENSVSSMKTLAKRAAEYGITYGIEAVNRFEGVIVNTSKEALDYVNMVDSKNVGILLDTYHMNIEENNIGDAIRTAGITRIEAEASTCASVVNRSKICREKNSIASANSVEISMPHTAITRRMAGTRSYFFAPRFCPTMVEPAVVKELDTMPIIMLILL